MPWNPQVYPRSMSRLSEPVQLKAIEIANALLDEGADDGKAIRIAIAKAKEWERGTSASRPATPIELLVTAPARSMP